MIGMITSLPLPAAVPSPEGLGAAVGATAEGVGAVVGDGVALASARWPRLRRLALAVGAALAAMATVKFQIACATSPSVASVVDSTR